MAARLGLWSSRSLSRSSQLRARFLEVRSLVRSRLCCPESPFSWVVTLGSSVFSALRLVSALARPASSRACPVFFFGILSRGSLVVLVSIPSVVASFGLCRMVLPVCLLLSVFSCSCIASAGLVRVVVCAACVAVAWCLVRCFVWSGSLVLGFFSCVPCPVTGRGSSIGHVRFVSGVWFPLSVCSVCLCCLSCPVCTVVVLPC